MCLQLRIIAQLFLGLVFCLFLASCSWKANFQPSILVIMVEDLGFSALSCSEGTSVDIDVDSGFQTFCEESVRFTHAYTPSTMSQAVVASILTAQYPFQHGVRHNGSQAIPAYLKTIPEVALQKNYHTSFFSGGPPIWRRSGLSQGFEYFDDTIQISEQQMYRPASEVVKAFLRWQESDAQSGHFLSFLYFSDLQFIDVPTTNELGELRGSSYRGQIDEVGESLMELVRDMKKKKIWDATDVFLIGLNGHSSEDRIDEISGLNLYSESTRVTLMIKPSRKVRDGPFNWKIDANVSLVDVGATLRSLLGVSEKRVDRSQVPEVVSLKQVLNGPEPDWNEDRLIISESSWSQWKGIGGIRGALRRGQYLYLFDGPDLIFNTLTDNLELSPLPEGETKYQELRAQLARELKSLGYRPWSPPPRLWGEKLELARELWRRREPEPETLRSLRRLSKAHSNDSELLGWRAIWAIRRQDWNELKEVSASSQNKVWAYVAAKNLGQKTELPTEPCLVYLLNRSGDERPPKECVIEGTYELAMWANEGLDQEIRDRSMEAFMRIYSARWMALRIAQSNYVAGAKWDVAPSLLNEPDQLDLFLALPDLRKYRQTVTRRLTTLKF